MGVEDFSSARVWADIYRQNENNAENLDRFKSDLSGRSKESLDYKTLLWAN